LRQLEQRSRQDKQTQMFIETPYRNEAMLEAIVSHCTSTTLLSIATDLTLETESVRTQSVLHWKKEIAAGQFPDFRKKPTVFSLLAR
jgi:16S rRNA (cytidine1402-2'-O)-methyltransferase